MIILLRTDSSNPDFQKLVTQLDSMLKVADGDDHVFYAQYNKTDTIRNVIVAYMNDIPVGCGAFKLYAEHTAEIKRMYVLPEARRQGVAAQVLAELEKWAKELGYSNCILETGKKLEPAVNLYKKNGYSIIPNYGQYADVELSVCMQKPI